jgi:hypothetical protein
MDRDRRLQRHVPAALSQQVRRGCTDACTAAG